MEEEYKEPSVVPWHTDSGILQSNKNRAFLQHETSLALNLQTHYTLKEWNKVNFKFSQLSGGYRGKPF